MLKKYEVVVIGGGPGGYVAAIRAAKLGKKVALVEADYLGGTCLNRGCIPSKTLLRHAEVIENIEKAKVWGIETGPITFSLSKMLKRKDQVIKQLRTGIGFLLKQGKIDVYEGLGEVQSNQEITIQLKDKQETIYGEKIILATGSTPVVPPIDGIEETYYYTSDTVFDLEEIPKSIVIIGGGIIGVEFACIFSSLNVDVTIVEMADRITSTEDPEASKALKKSLETKGVKILTNTKVINLGQVDENKQVHIEKSNGNTEVIEKDAILLSVGRKPNLTAAKKLPLEMDGPFIRVNEKMQTNTPSIYAVGDVIGGFQLAHVASAEGLVAAANASGGNETVNYKVVPRCVYTNPEIASVGLTEEEVKAKGIKYKAVRVDHHSNGKALALDEKEGFVKLLADEKYGEILGVTMVGPHVTEMITEPSAFIHLEGTVDELATMIHPHPSVSESLFEAATSWLGKGVHS
ncbi:dihydrolipoyl dehydrogenase [Aquibacillus sp. 3ASR75-11]|uniref:Dihydrolipoyl dehydrogenase n=1 Tax=Terrihalobacillus insolitus TaxID=2950438 RepID=A0A9X3WSF2_9BACI|nr:dihydrolipoyl dehydrogenase [Terrihalobacillus insolitus]MDC3424575.1 dihydrolipoyl dehydrogenase [Terrihalobacillus insolitus]